MTAAAVTPTINRGVALAFDASVTSSATATTLIVTTLVAASLITTTLITAALLVASMLLALLTLVALLVAARLLTLALVALGLGLRTVVVGLGVALVGDLSLEKIHELLHLLDLPI